jgi:hypothetical protein
LASLTTLAQVGPHTERCMLNKRSPGGTDGGGNGLPQPWHKRGRRRRSLLGRATTCASGTSSARWPRACMAPMGQERQHDPVMPSLKGRLPRPLLAKLLCLAAQLRRLMRPCRCGQANTSSSSRRVIAAPWCSPHAGHEPCALPRAIAVAFAHTTCDAAPGRLDDVPGSSRRFAGCRRANPLRPTPASCALDAGRTRAGCMRSSLPCPAAPS